MKSVFIPISLNNDRYSTNNVIRLVESLHDGEQVIEILIADRLQIYNQVVSAFKERSTMLDIGRIEIGVGQTAKQRKKWSDRLLGRLSVPTERISVRDINEYTDSRFLDIFRRILILYDVDSKFRKDVKEYAEEYVVARVANKEFRFIEVARKMSVRYILEEAAISIRVRCYGALYAEYYFGEPAKPVVNLYRDQYMFQLAELSGIFDIASEQFLFINSDEVVPAL